MRARRVLEALDLLVRHAGDVRSALTLAGCYAATVRDPADAREVGVRLRIAGRRVPLALRRSDLYTLAEVLVERQYRSVAELSARPVVVDAGANVGIAALWFLAHRPAARLHCFEPEPENCRLLERNLQDWPQAVVRQAALAASDSLRPLHVARHGALHSLHPTAGTVEGPEVPCVELGAYLAEQRIERVDLLKLDVEGSEFDVLRGLGERLAAVERIAGEIHEDRVDAAALLALLDGAGFRVRRRRFPSGAGEPVFSFEARRGA